MTDFNFNKYLKNNPLLKETSGYGNYTQPEKMLEDDDYDYQNAEDFDLNPQDGENDPLGPDEELMEGSSETISLVYRDWPELRPNFQKKSVTAFKNLVKGLKGKAKVIKDDFETIDFALSDISSAKIKKAFEKVIEKENKKDFMDMGYGPFSALTSWILEDQNS